MAAIKITDNVFSVGVQNPDLEIFDIVMPTRFGTSYNSFLVKGATKTALVETSHAEFFDEYKANIAEVTDPASIDYIVVNHTEPDHSGALAALLGACPKAQIVCTAVAANYLKNITNRADLNVRVVKEGETLDLGGLTLKFIVAPLLHWPDTMMTYCPEEKVLFPCDFLGAHYSFAPMFDAKVRNLDDYRSAFKDYYDALPARAPMAPNRAFIQKFAKLWLRSEKTVYMWIMGVQRPDALTQSIIAKELKANVNDLFPDENEKD